MLYSVRGTLVLKDQSSAVIECGGVGYLCQTTAYTLSKLPERGREATLYTYLNVRENGVDLFGFISQSELNCFKMLTSVSGIGPKVALSILSTLSADRLALAVVGGDVKALTGCSGVGKKTAERIILELRDKVSNEAVAQGVSSGASAPLPVYGVSENISEAVSALLVLGYTQTEAVSAMKSLPQDAPVEELIKGALKALASGR